MSDISYKHIMNFTLIFPIEEPVPTMLYPIIISEVHSENGDYQEYENEHYSFTKRAIRYSIWCSDFNALVRLVDKIRKFVETNDDVSFEGSE